MPMLNQNNQIRSSQEISRKKLVQADYGFSSAFVLGMANHEDTLVCEEIVRLIPGKRLVAFGRWNNKNVVAKLFFSRHAKEHLQRELKGAQALKAAKIPSPALLHADSSRDRSMQVMIFERIENSESLDSYWERNKTQPESENILRALTLELATQHVLGLQQDDLHLKNFLVAGEKIYTLDGGSIQSQEGPLSTKQSLENLALFFSQLGIHTNKLQERLFEDYVEARSWLVKKSDRRFLQKAIRHWNSSRWQYFSKKIFRSSTQFAKTKNLRRFSMLDRRYDSQELQRLLDNPDAAFKQADALILKAGRTSTVAKITVGKQALVVKRYNIKGFWHGLSLIFKPSRARLSWRVAHQLHFVGINTAKPVAFIEKRFLGLRRKAYFIMEHIEGTRGDQFFETHAPDSISSQVVAKRIISIFFNLSRLRLSHGDLKITNLLIKENLEPVLIDLDSMREHQTSRSLMQHFRKDMQRLLGNWPDKPEMQGLFGELMGVEIRA